MNPPVQVWRNGNFRIVAVDDTDSDGDNVQMLVVERCYADCLGADMWKTMFSKKDDINDALDALACEIASRIEVLPQWVRDLVKKQCKEMAEVDGGAA